MTNGNNKTLAEVVLELKNELIDFAATRAAMLRSEMKEKLTTLAGATPAILIGVLLLLTAWFVLTACLVGLVAMAFAGNPWNYVIAMAIVGLVYLVLGGAVAVSGWQAIKQKGFVPERTLHTLKEDRIWLQTEAKTQL